jgi:hypothetical protein
MKKICKDLEGHSHSLTQGIILDIYLKRLRKTTEDLSHNTQLTISPIPPKYRPTAVQPQKPTWLENKVL